MTPDQKRQAKRAGRKRRASAATRDRTVYDTEHRRREILRALVFRDPSEQGSWRGLTAAQVEIAIVLQREERRHGSSCRVTSEGRIWVRRTLAYIARCAHCSRRTVIRAIKALEAAEVLIHERRTVFRSAERFSVRANGQRTTRELPRGPRRGPSYYRIRGRMRKILGVPDPLPPTPGSQRSARHDRAVAGGTPGVAGQIELAEAYHDRARQVWQSLGLDRCDPERVGSFGAFASAYAAEQRRRDQLVAARLAREGPADRGATARA